MDDQELLEAELRAAREELVRSGGETEDDWLEPAGRLPLLPERDPVYRRLALMTTEQLERDIERLERDLEDLREGWDREEPEDGEM